MEWRKRRTSGGVAADVISLRLSPPVASSAKQALGCPWKGHHGLLEQFGLLGLAEFSCSKAVMQGPAELRDRPIETPKGDQGQAVAARMALACSPAWLTAGKVTRHSSDVHVGQEADGAPAGPGCAGCSCHRRPAAGLRGRLPARRPRAAVVLGQGACCGAPVRPRGRSAATRAGLPVSGPCCSIRRSRGQGEESRAAIAVGLACPSSRAREKVMPSAWWWAATELRACRRRTRGPKPFTGSLVAGVGVVGDSGREGGGHGERDRREGAG